MMCENRETVAERQLCLMCDMDERRALVFSARIARSSAVCLHGLIFTETSQPLP